MGRNGFLAAGCVLVGFVLVLALRARPADPEARLPEQYRLAGLIDREQASNRELRREVDELRRRLDAIRRQAASRASGAAEVERAVARVRLAAGVVPVEGEGLRVTLDDSTLKESPTGNLNDLVIHSQDVQAVVNALWRSGAEAIAMNGERVVATSGVLCVGNTLLINGTVHSPPYVAEAIGASKARFEADPLVRRLHRDADAFGLRFSVDQVDLLRLPAFDGAVAPVHARPAGT